MGITERISDEGSGCGEKIWLQSDSGEIGLFKFPRVNPATLSITTEHVSEPIAYCIGQIVGVETARIDIACAISVCAHARNSI